ncbi:MAG: hypothetical protein ACM30E_03775, partial [Nitrososphaerales archaeon]
PPVAPTQINTPAAWHEYADPAGAFTLLYPDTWKIASQLANRVTFSFQPNGVANVDVTGTADATEGLRDALSSAEGMARYAVADQAGSYVIGSIEKGAWAWEPEGNYALLNVNDYGLSVQWLYVAIPRDKSHAVLAKVALVNGQVTQEQRETLGKILASVQPAGIATPAPQAQATAPPAQAPTQAPPTQAPTAPALPQPTQAPTAPAQPKGTPQVTTNQSVNLRSGPGTRYMVKAITQPGQKYDLVGQNQEGTWYQLCCVAGEKLWISKLVAILAGDATSIPVVEAPANPTTAPAAEATPTPGP